MGETSRRRSTKLKPATISIIRDLIFEFLNTIDMMSKYIKLTPSKNDKNILNGKCPYCKAKLKTLTIRINGKIWSCRNCKKSGTIIKFLIKVRKIGFDKLMINLESLAKRTQIRLERKIDLEKFRLRNVLSDGRSVYKSKNGSIQYYQRPFPVALKRIEHSIKDYNRIGEYSPDLSVFSVKQKKQTGYILVVERIFERKDSPIDNEAFLL